MIVSDAIDVLARRDPNLYQRAGELVTIVREPERADYDGDRRAGNDIVMRPGTPRIRTVSAPVVQLRLAQCAQWTKAHPRKVGERIAADPSPALAALVHSMHDYPGVRPIRGILETPALAPSGRVIDRAGYDAETGLVLLPHETFAPIADEPTRDQARSALSYLWRELFCDFPYRGLGAIDPADVDRRERYAKACACSDAFVGLSSLLTILARAAISGATPGAAYEASTQGSGKTLQIHAIATVTTGRPAGVMTFPVGHAGKPDDAELEKVLGAYALSGARVIAFDNVAGTFGGAALEKAMTAVDSIDLRVLGSSDQRTLPWLAVLMFSGNNMAMSDDVAQRTLVSRLESDLEDPRSRPSASFRHPDLLAWVKANRPQLVRAALVVLRAYIVAADKPASGNWGSFEAWSRLIPGAIAYAGGPNILDARPRAGSVDTDEAGAHVALLRGWPVHLFPDAVKAGDLVRAVFADEREILAGKKEPDGLDDFRSALRTLTNTGDGRVPNTGAVGSALSRRRDKWRDDRALRGAPGHGGFVRWRVELRGESRGNDARSTVAAQTIAPASSAELDPAEDFER